MLFYLHTNLLILLFCFIHKHSLVEGKAELKKNVLKFGYRINYKYKGMLACSFDRFYVVTKFILQLMDDLKLAPIRYDKDCQYLYNLDDRNNEQIKENIKDLLTYYMKLRPI